MKILIFDTSIQGHHLEYIHHLYHGMKDISGHELILVVPEEFKERKKIYRWDDRINCSVLYLSNDELAHSNSGSMLKCSYKRACLLVKYLKKCKPDRVILIMLMTLMPFIALIAPGKVKISGIVYKIYLYRWIEMSFSRKCMEVANYLLIKYCKKISTVYILNDKSAASYFTRLYKTSKFHYLPDPFNTIEYKGNNLRDKYGISPMDLVYLHFGTMTCRKGTMEILGAIEKLTAAEANNKVFIFAGLVLDDIRDIFYKKIDDIQSKCRILLIDKFCSVEELTDLCETTDYILCPYKATNLSSGVLGYAAYFQKMVIGPKSGLIGKLIRRYNLGVTIPKIEVNELYEAISGLDKRMRIPNNYLSNMTIDNFCKTILL